MNDTPSTPTGDSSQSFLQSHRRINPDETFRFACHSRVPCFNACCSDLDLPLTPFDLLRLRTGLSMDSERFLHRHALVDVMAESGFPSVRLRMRDDKARSCPFVTRDGCSVYAHRPGSCRTYPLGRATRVDQGGTLIEQFFLIEEAHCRGFEEQSAWSTGSWMADQGMDPAKPFDDAFTRLLHAQKLTGVPANPALRPMLLMAMYAADRFQEFARRMGIFDKMSLPPERIERIMGDQQEALRFAFEWVHLLLVSRKGRTA